MGGRRNGDAGTLKGREAGFTIGTEYDVTYHYNSTTGRFEKVIGPGLPAGGVEYEPLKRAKPSSAT